MSSFKINGSKSSYYLPFYTTHVLEVSTSQVESRFLLQLLRLNLGFCYSCRNYLLSKCMKLLFPVSCSFVVFSFATCRLTVEHSWRKMAISTFDAAQTEGCPYIKDKFTTYISWFEISNNQDTVKIIMIDHFSCMFKSTQNPPLTECAETVPWKS